MLDLQHLTNHGGEMLDARALQHLTNHSGEMLDPQHSTNHGGGMLERERRLVSIKHLLQYDI